jgi:NTP pyrophosphatase (non-canonical NTP hydrolase)
MLIVSEAAEALEDVRNGDFELRVTSEGKPVGLPSELADIIIRVADYAEWQGYDLTAAIQVKQAYNENRPHKHGGKAI